MAIAREPIYAALFALGSASASFTTSSRRLTHIEDLAPSQFPAFYQVQVKESWKHGSHLGAMPQIGALHVEWWLYVFDGNPTASHGSDLNPLVDALLASLSLPPLGITKQTLGGLVESVQLNGDIQFAEGVLGDRAIARIPLLINTTS